MSYKNYYEQTDAQFKIRLPHELKEKIRQSAEQHNRTMTADIVARLEQSFSEPTDADKDFTLFVAALSYQFTLEGKPFKEFQNLLRSTLAIMDDPKFVETTLTTLNKKPTA